MSFKQPGPGSLGESVFAGGGLPELDGFVLSKAFWLDRSGGGTPHLTARYDSARHAVIVVSHESGPELWVALVDGIITAAAAGAVTALVEHIRAHRWRNDRGTDGYWAREIKRAYNADGTVRYEEIRELGRPVE